MDARATLEEVLEYTTRFLDELPDRPVTWSATVDELRAALDAPLPEAPSRAEDVIADLIKSAEAGIVGTTSPRYFGFVIGGALPVTVAADWLTTTWDQNAGLFVAGPSASVVEEVAGRWLKEIFGLPPSASFAFVTGCQMAHFTCLAAARNHVLAQQGWNVEIDGLQGAPKIRVLGGAARHDTIDRALRYLGLGTGSLVPVEADDQGRMSVEALRREIGRSDGPTIVCAQAGNVNSGAFDGLGEICEAAHEAGAWVHVDGAFGLWAAISPSRRHLVEGVELADSWATDAHKWLNVPYDSGLAFVAHPKAHREAMQVHASYLIHSEGDRERDQMDWTPEFSRRARGFTVYAAMKALGREGMVEMIDRCCDNARLFAEILGADDEVEIVNEVVLNQVLVRFAGDDDRTRSIVSGVQQDGTCWLSGSNWRGRAVMRISVSNWATTEEDVRRSADAILRVAALNA
jgi:glutamate/tyrosine decarboxylase-like PLP-dependent enzyme